MKFFLLVQFVTISIIVLVASSLKIAIIGAGIGGASASHYIKDLLPDATITVFERGSDAGGRLKSFTYNETNVELGGSIAVKANRYFHDLAVKFNLTISSPLSVPGPYAISNGTHLIFQGSTSFMGSWTKMLYTYGLSPMILAPKVSTLVSDFSQIYDIQQNGVTFRSSGDLWHRLSLLNYTQMTLRDALLDSSYFNFYPFMTSSFIDEFASSITHINYLQSPNSMHSLAGLIAVTPLFSGKENIFRIQEGNTELIRKMLKSSGANVLVNHSVTQIQKFNSEDVPHIQWNVTVAANDAPFTFDAVILAAPLELADIDIRGDDIDSILSSRRYQKVHTSIVRGEIRPVYFGLRSINEIPTTVGATNTLTFASFSILSDLGTGKHLVKLFSAEPLTETLLKQMFKDEFEVVASTAWDAYPQFKAGLQMMNFSLSDGLYYLNAIESGGSCIEISIISGRNAALLLKQDVEQRQVSSRFQYDSSDLEKESARAEL